MRSREVTSQRNSPGEMPQPPGLRSPGFPPAVPSAACAPGAAGAFPVCGAGTSGLHLFPHRGAAAGSSSPTGDSPGGPGKILPGQSWAQPGGDSGRGGSAGAERAELAAGTAGPWRRSSRRGSPGRAVPAGMRHIPAHESAPGMAPGSSPGTCRAALPCGGRDTTSLFPAQMRSPGKATTLLKLSVG